MSRVIYESGDVVSEAFSPETRLQYTPKTLQGQVIFQPERFTSIGGRQIARTPEPALILPLSECLQREYEVTLPDGTTTRFPGIVAMLIIQAAFDAHYNERAEAEAEQVSTEPVDDAALPAPEASA